MAKNKKFRKLLKDRNVKRKVLAERLGVSAVTVGYWLKGRYRPAMQYTIAMAKFFNLRIDEMYAIFKDSKSSKRRETS